MESKLRHQVPPDRSATPRNVRDNDCAVVESFRRQLRVHIERFFEAKTFVLFANPDRRREDAW